MNGPYVDMYVLCPERSEALAQQFLAEWGPRRIQSVTDYCIPELSTHPTRVFTAADELIRFLVANDSEAQALYWQSGRDDEVAHVMLFFTSDGGMVAGLSISDWERPRNQIARVFFRLADSVDARFGYVTAEEAPVYEKQDAFRAECARREIALIDGAKVAPT